MSGFRVHNIMQRNVKLAVFLVSLDILVIN